MASRLLAVVEKVLLGLITAVFLANTAFATSPIGYPSTSSCSSTPPPLSTGTDPGFPGHWWNPNRYGTGWEFNFSSDQTQLTLYWLTFNSTHLPVWLTTDSAGSDIGPNGEKEFWANFYLIPSPRPASLQPVGKVAVVFVAGSSTAAAVRWQWDAAGPSTHDECVYNYLSGAAPPPNGGSTASSSGTNVDGSYTGQWYDPNQSGWGVAISAGTNSAGSWELDEPLLYDTAGQPVWLQGSLQNPTTVQTSTSLGYVYSNYSGGFPTYSCSGSSVPACVKPVANVGTFMRSFNSSMSGSATIVANVASNAVPGATVTPVNWPANGAYNPAALAKLTDYYNINVSVTNCQIAAGQSTCPVVVGWTSTSSAASIYRRNLADGVLTASPIWSGASGQNTDYLSAGSDVQYELRDSTNTLLFVSPEVIVAPASGNTTPVSAQPNVVTPPTTTDTVSDAVGATVAQFHVDDGGNATYSIPIQVPPGTAGMVPKLSLNYNSRMPTGVMGPGWNIEGGSSITRCRQARENGDFFGSAYPDGNPQPIDFLPQDDRYCLDGVRLLLLNTSSAQYGQNGSTYSPENDPSTLVTASVSTYAQGPDYFTVQRKDGTTSIYGSNGTVAANNARPTATANGATVAVAWNLARAQDSSGNYIDYVYTQQPGTATLPFAAGAVESILSKVNYTGHATSPVSATYASVTFNYNTLVAGDPGIRLGYQAGVPFLQSQQLRSVTVTDGGNTVRYYQLNYQSSASGTGLQQLASIKECRASNQQVCYPPTVFTWSTANYTFVADSNQTQSGPDFTSLVSFKIADVDGDGRLDLVWAKNGDASCPSASRIYVSFLDRNTSTGQLTLVTPSQAVRCAPINLQKYDGAWNLLDYDGDGRADLMIGGAIGDKWHLYLSAGRPAAGAGVFGACDQLNDTSCSTRTLATPIPVASFLLPDGSSSQGASGLLADLNGDGLPDFVYPSAANAGSDYAVVQARLMVRQSNGTFGFSNPYAITLNVTDGHCSASPTTTCTFNFFNGDTQHRSAIATDINGDGRADLTMFISAYTDVPCNPCQKLPSGGQLTFNPQLATDSGTSSSSVTHSDYWYQFTAAGISQPAGYAIPVITLNEYWSAATTASGGTLPSGITGMYIADVNGDGLADILYQNPSNASQVTVLINTGSGYRAPISFTASPAISGETALQLADINGDGHPDIVFRTSNSAYGYVGVVPSGSGWAFTTQKALPGSFTGGLGWISLLGDIDGDAVPDYLAVQVTSGTFYTARVASSSRYHLHDAITTFTNGLGATTTINYQPLTNNAVYQSGTLAGATAFTPINTGYGSPVFYVLAPMYVVASASSSAPAAPGNAPQQNNPAAQSAVYYQYKTAAMQAGGRGFIGFNAIYTYDVNDQATLSQYVFTMSSHNQLYPFFGMATITNKFVRTSPATLGSAALDTCAANGPESAAGCFGTVVWPTPAQLLITQGRNWPACSGVGCTVPPATNCSTGSGNAFGSFTPSAPPQPLFVYVAKTNDAQYEYTTGAGTSFTNNYFCYDTSTPSAFSNLLASATTTIDNNSATMAQKFVANTYTDDTAHWLLGRLTQSVVTFTRPSLPSISRKTTYCYDMATAGSACPTPSGANTGLLTQEEIETGVAAGPGGDEDLRTVYTLDAYGNRTAAYQCNTDVPVSICARTTGTIQRTTGKLVHRFARTTYDSIGRYALTSLLPFANGTGNVDEEAAVTTNARDEFGNPVQQTSINGLAQYAKFGALGRPYFASDNTGKTSTTTYRLCTSVSCPADAVFRSQTVMAGAPTTWTYYDVLGRPVMTAGQTFDANPANSAFSGSCTFYDSHDRPIYQTEPFFLQANIGSDGSPSLTNSTQCRTASYATKTYYDILGRVIRVTNPDGGIIVKTYNGLVSTTSSPRNANWVATETRNALGELVSTQDPVDSTDATTGLTVTQQYDAAGNVLTISRTTAVGGTVITSMYYDDLGRKYKIVDPDAGTTLFTYNAAGDVISQTDAKGQVVTQNYDVMGRRWQRITGSMTDQWNYDYDAAHSLPCVSAHSCGMLTSESRSDGSNPSFNRALSYDAFGRGSQRSTSIAGVPFTETTAYDQFGRLLAQQDASGYSLFPEYSPNGFAGKQMDTRTGAVYQVLGMDARGHVTSDERAGSAALTSTIGYDPRTGRISSVCSGNSCGLQYLSYTFDVAGNLTQRGRNVVLAPTIEQFTYDALNRLTKAQLVRINGSYQTLTTEALAYDQLGNICSKNGNTYQYGPLSACPTHAASGGPHEVMAIGATSYSYDADGNQTGGGGRTLVYNALNQLVSASSSSATTTFLYTPDGDRFQRYDSTTGKTTWFVGTVELLRSGGVTTETRRYLAGAAIDYIRASGGNETRYVFNDHLGSTDTIVNSQGVVIESVSFDAHGNLRNPITWNGAAAAPTSTNHGFTGHEEVYSLGLTHMNGRIYDPNIGRMLQADPLTGPGNQSLNRYSYVVNNPLSLTDPTGYSWWRDIAAIAIVVFAPELAPELFAEYGFAATVATGFVAGVVQSDHLSGGLYGAFSAGLFYGAGQYFDNAAWAHVDGSIGATNLNLAGYSAKVLAHGVIGGVVSELQGGKFGNGFVSAGAGEAAGPWIDSLDPSHPIGVDISAQRVIAAAVVGGTTSAITGGKFGNGAVTAAFGRAFNEEAKIRQAKRQFPPFEKLKANYPPLNADGSPAHPSADGYPNQCAIRLGFDFIQTGEDMSDFTGNRTREGYPRGSQALMEWITRDYGTPDETTTEYFYNSVYQTQQGIFVESFWNAQTNHWETYHIDIFYQGHTGSNFRVPSVPIGNAKMTYWTIK